MKYYKKNNYFSLKKDFNQEDKSNYNYIQRNHKNFKQLYFTELYDNVIESKNIKDLEYKLCNKKRKSEKESFIFFKKEEPADRIKRGRKVQLNNKES